MRDERYDSDIGPPGPWSEPDGCPLEKSGRKVLISAIWSSRSCLGIALSLVSEMSRQKSAHPQMTHFIAPLVTGLTV